MKGTWGTETSNYPEEKKVKTNSESSGERNRRSPNLRFKYRRGKESQYDNVMIAELVWKTRPKEVKAP